MRESDSEHVSGDGSEMPTHSPRVLVEWISQTVAFDTAILDDAGYQVITERSFPANGHAASSRAPDLIIIQGVAVADEALVRCRQIRAVAETRGVPIIVVTKFDDLYTREQIVRAGATAILVEPVKPPSLLRQIRRLLTRSMLRQQP
jgi:DNA-binding response OmpR family regulator